MENYNKELEDKLLEMVKSKEESDRGLLLLEWVIAGLSLIILLVPMIFAAFLQIAEWQMLILIFSGFIPAIIGFSFATRIEQVAGYYKCRKCNHKHIPSYASVLFSMHLGRTRYMKCPTCQKRSWQKKVISKD